MSTGDRASIRNISRRQNLRRRVLPRVLRSRDGSRFQASRAVFRRRGGIPRVRFLRDPVLPLRRHSRSRKARGLRGNHVGADLLQHLPIRRAQHVGPHASGEHNEKSSTHADHTREQHDNKHFCLHRLRILRLQQIHRRVRHSHQESASGRHVSVLRSPVREFLFIKRNPSITRKKDLVISCDSIRESDSCLLVDKL